jgi:hypothetical protein
MERLELICFQRSSRRTRTCRRVEPNAVARLCRMALACLWKLKVTEKFERLSAWTAQSIDAFVRLSSPFKRKWLKQVILPVTTTGAKVTLSGVAKTNLSRREASPAR